MGLIGTSCGFFYFIRTALRDWGKQYLITERGVSSYACTDLESAMDIGGVLGSISAAALTDFLIKKRFNFGSGKSPRMLVAVFISAGVCMGMNLFLFAFNHNTTVVSTSPPIKYKIVRTVSDCKGLALDRQFQLHSKRF